MDRAHSGWKAKQNGKGFESYLIRQFERQGWTIIKIPDGCRMLSATRFIKQRSPYDFMAVKNDQALFFDAKHRANGKNVVPSMFSGYSTEHQKQTLKRIALHNSQNIRAGFIVHLSEVDETYWLDARSVSRETIQSKKIGSFSEGLDIKQIYEVAAT